MKRIPGLNSLCSVEGLPVIHEVGVWPCSKGGPIFMLLGEYLAQLGLILCSAANFFHRGRSFTCVSVPHL